MEELHGQGQGAHQQAVDGDQGQGHSKGQSALANADADEGADEHADED